MNIFVGRINNLVALAFFKAGQLFDLAVKLINFPAWSAKLVIV